jgi:hypothetical protein
MYKTIESCFGMRRSPTNLFIKTNHCSLFVRVFQKHPIYKFECEVRNVCGRFLAKIHGQVNLLKGSFLAQIIISIHPVAAQHGTTEKF